MTPFPLGSRRQLKNTIARLLPDAIKRRVHGRLYGYGKSRVDLPIEFSSDERGSFVLLDRHLKLRFREEEREELQYHLVRNGESIEETKGFIELAAPATTLFDVGAAKSMYSRLFCLTGPEKRAVAYEPSPTQMQAAEAMIADIGCESRTRLRQCFVSTGPGRAAAWLSPNGFVGLASGDDGGQPVEVEITSIDHEVATLGIVPDLLKIDVEGYEHEVLIGARQLLRTHKPPICLELHLGTLEQRGIAPRQVVEELQSHGYRFRSYLGRDLTASDVWDSMHAILRFVAH